MVRALGYSSSDFNPRRPGRLCRGRERWIQAWEQDDVPVVHRLVVSGAAFSDDSARDALRGLDRSGVDAGELMAAVFPDAPMLAFREEGELAVVPPDVEDEGQEFRVARRGGAWFQSAQRWRMPVLGAEAIGALVAEDNVDGFVVLGPEGVTPALDDALFMLTGMGDGSAYPVKRFQPLGIVEVLQHAPALIAVHLDKHGPALAIYTLEPLDRAELIETMAAAAGALPVPFAIPPMLARWDRALQELRVHWMETRDDEFPVPPADEPTRWSRLGQKLAQAPEE
jgi:hypothetical protein